ncbi:glycosyltransferase [Falsiroseomonas sp. E2-1-a20]|uniref:glycosyltransferase n=1 Tax=Falsiroseomonas sp. E2-1-a20 TaxID=3239300 RepID=UPI003F31469B
MRAAIAIPAHNEADRLPACLAGLAAQRLPNGSWDRIGVLVLANNCTDDTVAQARALEAALPFRLILRDVVMPEASAGHARRRAMAMAASWVAEDGALLTTDADAVADPGWLAGNLGWLAAGADAVAGAIRLDTAEAAQLPPLLREQIRAEERYALLIDRLASLLDPEPLDPWPRHSRQSGASLALTRHAWAGIGGVPDQPAGEDRAMVAALRRAGLRVRHAPEVRTTVSARLDGRAAAGMAETLRHRLLRVATTADDRLEPVGQALFRLRCRAQFRLAWQARAADGAGPLPAALAGLDGGTLDRALGAASFWAGWEQVESASPRLAQQALPLAALRTESLAARGMIAALKSRPEALPHAARARSLAGGS